MDNDNKNESSRRKFLGQTALSTGALVLGLQSLSQSAHAANDKTDDDLVLKLKANTKLQNVGGFEVVDSEVGRLIVAHTDEGSFIACSAICPHRGCEVVYNANDKQFVCPCHNSRFALDGSVVKGPAKQALPSYAADGAAVISIKTDG